MDHRQERCLDDRFHETTQLHLGLTIHGMRPFRLVSRRTLVAAAVAGAGAIALAPREALSQAGPVAPPAP